MKSQQTPVSGSIARRYASVAEQLPLPDEIDWSNAPSQFKRYEGCPRLALGYEAPAQRSRGANRRSRPTFEQLGQLLSDVYGLTRHRWTVLNSSGTLGPDLSPRPNRYFARSKLRPVPSGGARFPCELYLLVGTQQALPAGIHHYDPAHHMIEVLRDGDFGPVLAACLGRPREEAPSLTLLLSVFFWKNAFKYGEFSYRLQSLDLGVVIAQILAVADRYGLRAKVHYQFLDAKLDDLIGLDPSRESVYAAVNLGEEEIPQPNEPAKNPRREGIDGGVASPKAPTEQRWSIQALPLPAELHRASMLTDAKSFVPGNSVPSVVTQAPDSRRSIELANPGLDLLAGLRRRRSSMGHFAPSGLTREQLSKLLGASALGYPSDLDGDPPSVRHTLLFCAINSAEGIDPGIYYYRPDRQALEQVYAADVRAELQANLTYKNVNMFRVGLCVFPVASYESGFDPYGDRWYRVQNAEAGILVQRLYLAAAALGLACHVSCGFVVDRTNALLGLTGGDLTSLAQVMVGPGEDVGHFYEQNSLL